MSILKRPQIEKYKTRYNEHGVVFINQFGREEFQLIEIQPDGFAKVRSIEKNSGDKYTKIRLKIEDIRWDR